MDDLTYKYYRKAGGKTVFLVLHGSGSKGVESLFISMIINSVADNKRSVLGINMPYCERGEEEASQDLAEEVLTVEKGVEFLKNEGYEKIVIVAKSLGGIIASKWIVKHAIKDVDLIVLGYAIGSVPTEQIIGNLRIVIQGELDRFGGIDELKKELDKAGAKSDIIIIKNADHSYRDMNKKPLYQGRAIKELLSWINKNYCQ